MTRPRKPRIPPGVTITDDGLVHFPPFVFPAPDDVETPEEWGERCDAAWRKQLEKYSRFCRAYERWHPESKYNRELKRGK